MEGKEERRHGQANDRSCTINQIINDVEVGNDEEDGVDDTENVFQQI